MRFGSYELTDVKLWANEEPFGADVVDVEAIDGDILDAIVKAVTND